MKRITISLFIALVAVTSVNCVAEKTKTTTETATTEQAANAEQIPFEKLVSLIATSEHFDENNLTALGMEQLISTEESFADEDDEGLEGAAEGDVGSMLYFVYAKNATAELVEGEHGDELRLTSTGPHAYGIEVHLDTDNGTRLYFKEKADHDAFLECLRKSEVYEKNEHANGVTEYLGNALLEGDNYEGGWWVIDFHHG